MESNQIVVEACSPINIALVKYWGKADDELIIPTCPSFSITINKADLSSTTRVTLVEPDQQTDAVSITLNGQSTPVTKRIQNVVDTIKKKVQDPSLLGKKISLVSQNNFKTAAGMASSASGLACLAMTLAKAYSLTESFPGEFSLLARLGSGSACRSVYGGFVQWHTGFDKLENYPGLDKEEVSRKAIATRFVFDQEEYWREHLRILICIVKPEQGQNEIKDIPSTQGMKLSQSTSDLFKYRHEKGTAEIHIEELKQALIKKDFNKFAEVTIKESNQLHATCLDTYPPIFYMNSTSKQICSKVISLNNQCDENIAAYSIDAGFHVFVFCMQENLLKVKGSLQEIELEGIIETTVDQYGVQLI